MADGDAHSLSINLPAQRMDLGDDCQGFFAPVKSVDIAMLLKQYQKDRAAIEAVSQAAEAFFGDTLHHFIKGNIDPDRRPSSSTVTAIFALSGAIASLDAEYWSRALRLTDVYDHMPTKRRQEWDASIREHKTPAFEPETVVNTLRDLLAMREQFLAERVDGIFRALSGEHVTNAPEAYGKRMIIGWMLNSYGSVNHERSGYIQDLRAVIARFMGMDEPTWAANDRMLESLKKATGEWHVLDGGAIKIRLYKKGTAHMEIHPDMAWRLNAILAYLYPAAIPASFRQKPKRQKKHDLLQRPLPFKVLAYLSCNNRYNKERDTYALDYDMDTSSAAYAEAAAVIAALGGVPVSKTQWRFNYDWRPVFQKILLCGCLPDKVTHQFYPTPDALVQRVHAEAGILREHRVLEPSAGTGKLLKGIDPEQVTAVEVSDLHAAILRGQGYDTHQADFIEWAQARYTDGTRFDRIIMNPPFSDGRAKAHVEAAVQLLADGGRLVAVMPASFAGKPLAGRTVRYSEPIENAFADASVTVVLAVIE